MAVESGVQRTSGNCRMVLGAEMCLGGDIPSAIVNRAVGQVRSPGMCDAAVWAVGRDRGRLT
jgi:hypothetical protein